MNGLAVVTWRLPHATLEDLERVRETLDAGDPREAVDPPVFAMATCQRVLLATQATDGERPEALVAALAESVDVPGAERLRGPDALRHLTEVAASLDALVPGEDQVPGQFRDAVDEHVDGDRLAGPLEGTLQRVISMARTVRAESGLQGRASRSLADLTAPMVPDGAGVAVLGTGQMARALLESLDPERVDHVVSRDPARARQVAPDGTRAWDRDAFAADPPGVDVLVLCTRASQAPVLEQATARALLEAREDQAALEAADPLLILDLGLPRNADPSIATLSGVDLRTMGDLARVCRGRLLEDEHVTRAWRSLERVLERERARQAKQRLEDHITALRESVDEAFDALVDELASTHPGLDDEDLDRLARRVQGRLAHDCQEHLVAAARGEDPR